MNTGKISEENKYNRRRFLGVAAMGIAASEFVMIGSANAQSRQAFAQAIIDVDSL